MMHGRRYEFEAKRRAEFDVLGVRV